MNSRSLKIIKKLLSGNTFQISELADSFGFTSRLIRYEIDEIDAFLSRVGFGGVLYDRSGVSLPIPDEEKRLLRDWLSRLSVDDISLSSEERIAVVEILLLSSCDYLTSQYFADLLGVSKSCIEKDLSLLKNRIQEEDLQLLGKPGSGKLIVGEERNIREICMRLVEHNLNFIDYLSGEEYFPLYVETQIQKNFCDKWVHPLIEIIDSCEHINEKKLSYSSFRHLLLYLCVALTRVSCGNILTVNPENQKLLSRTKEYEIAERLCEKINENFAVELPVSEICNIAVLLVSAKQSTAEPYLNEDWVQIQLLADRLIRAMGEKLSISFSDDEDLFNALQSHLGPMVCRLKNRIPLINSSLDQIKSSYNYIFTSLQSVIQTINSPLLEGIQEDNIAYLVLHFCASIERRERRYTKSRVAIVCVQGIGTASLLKELVSSRFKNIQVVTTTTEKDINFVELEGVDFIISSISLNKCAFPWVKVSPILTDHDFEQIEQMMKKHSSDQTALNNSNDFFEDIVSIIESQCIVDNKSVLMTSLTQSFEKAGVFIKKNKIQPSLSQLLPPERIRCQQSASNWEDAVRLAGSVLLENGDVTSTFINSAIDAVRKAGPYIVVSKGVALVHSEIGCGVRNLSMSMITLSDPVLFHHPINDPVKLILCLAPIDNYSHVAALEDFLVFLRRHDVNSICEETDTLKIHQYLQRSKKQA